MLRVTGSIRETVASYAFVTQMAPSPRATPVGAASTGISPSTSPLPGSINPSALALSFVAPASEPPLISSAAAATSATAAAAAIGTTVRDLRHQGGVSTTCAASASCCSSSVLRWEAARKPVDDELEDTFRTRQVLQTLLAKVA